MSVNIVIALAGLCLGGSVIAAKNMRNDTLAWVLMLVGGGLAVLAGGMSA